MSYEERNTIVALFTNLSVMTLLTLRLLSLHQGGAFAGPAALELWAQNVLWIIPASIVAAIILSILFNIGFAIVTREKNPDFVVDERDKAFGIKAMQTTIVVASAGFIGALGALAMGWQALIAFNIILGAFALGDLSGNVLKLFLYRRGY